MIENLKIYQDWRESDHKLRIAKSISKHETIIEEYLDKEEKNTDTIVFSLGCSNNASERAPNFAIELAKKGEKVSVYNFDSKIFSPAPNAYGVTVQDSPEQQNAIISRQHPNMTLRFLTESLRFPSRDEEGIEKYVQQIIKNKRSNPNLKFVFLFAVGSISPTTAFSIVEKIKNSGLFTQGLDLELVMAYNNTVHKQAAVLRGKVEEDILNYIYRENRNVTNVFYNANKNLYFFPILDDVHNIFSELVPTPELSDASLRHNQKPRQSFFKPIISFLKFLANTILGSLFGVNSYYGFIYNVEVIDSKNIKNSPELKVLSEKNQSLELEILKKELPLLQSLCANKPLLFNNAATLLNKKQIGKYHELLSQHVFNDQSFDAEQIDELRKLENSSSFKR